ncbi:hypothetical protein TorRG33x02_024640 [Trema orientale]|uniref:Uncharacterized protein n=1 Tax=Trema orientale TaxID=63057 RepID=A0A2P5FVA5_TREOI|nr:hypothetical protein TorRG33x02_024640 [Trema orientale]
MDIKQRIQNDIQMNKRPLADWKRCTIPAADTFQHWIDNLPLAHCREHLVKLLTG